MALVLLYACALLCESGCELLGWYGYVCVCVQLVCAYLYVVCSYLYVLSASRRLGFRDYWLSENMQVSGTYLVYLFMRLYWYSRSGYQTCYHMCGSAYMYLLWICVHVTIVVVRCAQTYKVRSVIFEVTYIGGFEFCYIPVIFWVRCRCSRR